MVEAKTSAFILELGYFTLMQRLSSCGLLLIRFKKISYCRVL